MFLQVLASGDGGSVIDLPWLLASGSAIVAALSSAVVAVYRGRIADLQASNARKDALIDRLLAQLGPLADVADRSVGLAEREHGIRTRSSR